MSLIVQCRHCRLLVVNQPIPRRWHHFSTHGMKQWKTREAFVKVKKLQFSLKERMTQ